MPPTVNMTSTHTEPTVETKTCPRCGSTLFADMNVCYGCLYDFSTDVLEPQDIPHAQMPELDMGDPRAEQDPSNTPSSSTAPASSPQEPDPYPELGFWQEEDNKIMASYWPAPSEPADPPADKPANSASPDATTDLGAVAALFSMPRLKVRTPQLSVTLDVPERGLVVGRHDSSDVVVKDPSVSRKQILIGRMGNALWVEDLGATNPTLANGLPILSRMQLPTGCVLRVGTVELEVIQTSPQ